MVEAGMAGAVSTLLLGPRVCLVGPCEATELDGSTYEGGGGLIRYAIAYSSLLNKPLHIHSIRANRPGAQGLRVEHTAAIRTLSKLALATVEGNAAGSRELWFRPHSDPGRFLDGLSTKLDVTTEGAASILLIALLPFMLFSHLASRRSQFSPKFTHDQTLEVVIRAGTLCVKAPSIFYLRQVLFPTFNLIGIGKENVHLLERYEQGWHTQGKKYPGKMPMSPPEVSSDFTNTLNDEITALLSADDTRTSHIEVKIEVHDSTARDQYHLLLVAETLSPTSFLGYEEVYPQTGRFPHEIHGDQEKIAEYLIRGCIRGLWKELQKGNAVDEHTEDVLVIYQSLASGFSSVESNSNARQVPEFNPNSKALDEAGQIYDIDTSTLHRQTSWWIAKLMADVQQKHRVIDGHEMQGCVGIALGQKPE
ncbi:hypothetical protein O1611_g8574 [Lasiodiplodia mahajangana]|uniref:Uncharacterized protein n=1 Tax=Lasiodiplodia mahajangana TaxID=1108764 RepID=A0ACC2JCD5_9PEZI|nr:hypothetical protein O1611_g8574 [Lasiodiplodia mahajangana]